MKSKIQTFLNSPIFCILAFLVLFSFQIINLDSDPSPLHGIGVYGDEGFWVHNARTKILFDNYLCDEFNQSYIVAPLFTFLECVSFRTIGVSYFSARLVSIVSFWLVLIMLFRLLKQHFNGIQALLTVVSIGISHELLMYSKWATPIFVEILFLVAFIFFWELGRKRHDFYYLLAGMAYPLAILSKLTSLYFFLSFLSFILIQAFVNKVVNVKRISIFVFGIVIIFVPFLIFFILPNIDQYRFFMATMGNYKIKASTENITTAVKFLLSFPFHLSPFKYPSLVCVLIFTTCWLVEFTVVLLKNGYKRTFENLSILELYSLCWILGTVATLIINSELGSDVRMVMLMIPSIILSTFYVFKRTTAFVQLKLNLEIKFNKETKNINFYDNRLKCALFGLFGLFFTYYIFRATQHLISWLSSIGINPYKSVWYLFGSIMGFSVSYLYFIKKDKRTLITLVLIIFFSMNIILNAIWYLGATYTIRDFSRKINQYSQTKTVFVGNLAIFFAVESNVLPVVYNISGNNETNNSTKIKINSWFLDYSHEKELLLCDTEFEDSGNGILEWSQICSTPRCFERKDFKKQKMALLTDIKLAPFPFTKTFRYEGKLYGINGIEHNRWEDR